jgi:hypothetical protein
MRRAFLAYHRAKRVQGAEEATSAPYSSESELQTTLPRLIANLKILGGWLE